MEYINKVADYVPKEVKEFDLTAHIDKRVVTGLALWGAFMLGS